jgi:parallel beta-helix repeat protein
MNKGIVVGITILFLGTIVTPSFAIDNPIKPISNGNTLYVGGTGPENYTKIQDAIDNASDGNTVYVFDDSSPYYEGIEIKKSINLIGENKNTTSIIGKYPYAPDTIDVKSENVNITDFTIKHIGEGYEIGFCINLEKHDFSISNCILSGSSSCINDDGGLGHNIIANNTLRAGIVGIVIESEYNTFENNEFFDCGLSGIDIRSSNNNVSFNKFSDSDLWIGIASIAHNNKIIGNIFTDRFCWICSPYNMFIENTFYDGGFLIQSDSNIIINNTNNGKPIKYIDGKTNIIINSGNYGQILMTSCANITITRLNLSNSHPSPIQLFNCEKCNIVDNNFISDIWISSTNHTLISKNNISKETNVGVIIDEHSNHNIISENNIKNCGYMGIACDGSYNKILNNTVVDNGFLLPIPSAFNWIGGIILESNSYSLCEGNIISGNLISSNKNVGIGIISPGGRADTPNDGPTNTLVVGNIITNNIRGISIQNSNNNCISQNNITNNFDGVNLYKSLNNTVVGNNFKKNIRQASFVGLEKNLWKNNYWGRPLLRPKIIFGRIGRFLNLIPWVNIDWHPAKEPYNIEGVI